MTKKTTIDDLAIMVKNGFDAVDARFDDIESRMATKDDLAKLDLKLSTKIDALETKVDAIATSHIGQIYDLRDRVRTIETKIGI